MSGKPTTIGSRYGRLTVVSRAESVQGKSFWNVCCDCGSEKRVSAANLRAGNTVSCGCFRNEKLSRATKTHGMSKHPIYSSWHAMKERCLNPNHPCYGAYGGRGIQIAEKWLRFEGFLEDMGGTHFPGASIDRKDNDGDYTAENCRWLLLEDNRKRKRSNLYAKYKGEVRSLRDLANERGLVYATVWARYRSGRTIDECLSTERLR